MKTERLRRMVHPPEKGQWAGGGLGKHSEPLMGWCGLYMWEPKDEVSCRKRLAALRPTHPILV